MDLEKDIEKVKKLNNLLNFFKTHGWIPNMSRETNINETIEAIEHLLAEREEDKKRIEELEDENRIQRHQIMTVYDNGYVHKDKIKEDYIPKQKVMDKVEELEVKYKNAFDNCLKSNGLNMTLHIKGMCINAKLTVLKGLLEDK